MAKMIFPSKYLSMLGKRAKNPTGWQKDFAKIVHERSKQKAKSII
jgi:hypothetical protein